MKLCHDGGYAISISTGILTFNSTMFEYELFLSISIHPYVPTSTNSYILAQIFISIISVYIHAYKIYR